MNWKRGFKRIAWVLSVVGFVIWLSVDIFSLLTEEWYPDFWWDPDFLIVLAFGVLTFIAVWVAYYAGLYIVKGFCGTQPLVGQQK